MRYVMLLLMLCAAACAFHDGRETARLIGQQEGFVPRRFATSSFVLFGLLRPGEGHTLRVYIEGDGRAWLTRGRPSADPTPRNPVALRLAARDPGSDPVLYLARPCQYVRGDDRRDCATADWTGGRLSEKVVRSLDAAISRAREDTGTRRVALFGYSGGGGAAVLLAARRDDVVFLGTVAGNLDHAAWTRHHGVSPLRGSLNPRDVVAKVRSVPQVHLSGADDTIVPPEIARSFCTAVGASARCPVIAGMTHGGAWESVWNPPAVVPPEKNIH